MKVLLRSDYTWYEAKWDPIQNKFIIGNGTQAVDEINIVSVKDDNRNKYVRCKGCGETILNTPSAIKKHHELSKTSKTCLSCKHCSRRNNETVSEKFTVNDDGTYNITTKTNATLQCRNGYYWEYANIDSPEARQRCKYASCESSGVETYKDIFSKYPGIFDDILTVDVLLKKKWEFCSRTGDGSSTFKVPIKFNLYATVTPQGFIDTFYYTYRNSIFYFMYSPKYAKIIWRNWRNYQEISPGYLSDSIIEKITKKVIELYKEVDKE